MIKACVPTLLIVPPEMAYNNMALAVSLCSQVHYHIVLQHQKGLAKFTSVPEICASQPQSPEVLFNALDKWAEDRRKRHQEVYLRPIFAIVGTALYKEDLRRALHSGLYISEDDQATLVEIDDITGEGKIWTLSYAGGDEKEWVEETLPAPLYFQMFGTASTN